MADGYYVFRCESPSAPFDLVAYRDGICHRVEVKSITVKAGPCAPTFSWPSNDEWDLLVVVDHVRDRFFRFTRDVAKDDARVAVREAYGFPANIGWNTGPRTTGRWRTVHSPQIVSSQAS
jgi:hypothetical protein